jgi:hypothetical protein
MTHDPTYCPDTDAEEPRLDAAALALARLLGEAAAREMRVSHDYYEGTDHELKDHNQT